MIRRLALRNFRVFEDAALELSAGATLFFGPNGTGKTTVLEAAHYLATGRSFRAGRDRECLRASAGGERAPFATIDGRVEVAGVEHHLRLALEGTRKTVWRDGSTLKTLSELWGWMRVVLLAPTDLELVRGGPATRRGALDNLMGQRDPSLIAALNAYGRALQCRNRLLRDRVRPSDPQYGAFETAMARAAVEVIGGRRTTIADLAAHAREPMEALAAGSEPLVFEYAPGTPGLEGLAAAEAAEALERRWRDEREGDARRGATRQGPHRDDVEIILGGSQARTFASQGQARCAALAWKLAELALQEREADAPVVLLIDDILGELDRERSDRFLDLVAGRHVQTLITATDAAGVEGHLHLAGRFHVTAGRLAPVGQSAG